MPYTIPSENAAERIPCPSTAKILVLGDLMLDRTVYGAADRTSPEAPVVVLRVGKTEQRPGGAAAVAHLLRGLELGINVSLAGVVGADASAEVLKDTLRRDGIHDFAVVADTSRPTTVKERFIGQASGRHAQQILRVDYETTAELAPEVTTRLWERVASLIPDCDAVLISDYAKGVCAPDLLVRVINACHEHGVPVLVDPARQMDAARYSGADLIKPNRTWLEMLTGQFVHDVASAISAIKQLRQQQCWMTERLLVTLDRDGMLLDEPGQEPVHFPARIRSVYDVTGAGDMVQAVLGACVSGGMNWQASSECAVSAAGLEVERFGVVPVAWSEISAERVRRVAHSTKIMSRSSIVSITENSRRLGKTIVFTNGCFDLLHAGHVRLLQQASELGEFLIVAINSDTSVRRMKGESRPFIREEQRAELLAALSCVDAVVVFDEETPIPLLQELRPDVLVKGAEYCHEQVVGGDVVSDYGGRIVTVPMVPGLSTTRLAQGVMIQSQLAQSDEDNRLKLSLTANVSKVDRH